MLPSSSSVKHRLRSGSQVRLLVSLAAAVPTKARQNKQTAAERLSIPSLSAAGRFHWREPSLLCRWRELPATDASARPSASILLGVAAQQPWCWFLLPLCPQDTSS